MVDLLVRNIGQLLSVPSKPRGEKPFDKIGMIKNAALAIKNGKIAWVGEDREVANNIHSYSQEVDAKNQRQSHSLESDTPPNPPIITCPRPTPNTKLHKSGTPQQT